MYPAYFGLKQVCNSSDSAPRGRPFFACFPQKRKSKIVKPAKNPEIPDNPRALTKKVLVSVRLLRYNMVALVCPNTELP